MKTLISAYERIPAWLKKQAAEIYIIDDCSNDNTYYAGLGYKLANNIKNLHVMRNKKNCKYGGNQKRGYRYAIDRNYDIVVMLHGDVQYAPEYIPDLLEPLVNNKADMTFGSRMKGNPLKGGMPLWKFIANKFLTFLENIVLGLKLSEYHSGFRAYTIRSLKMVPFSLCTNDFHFDTDILIQFKERGLRIKEVPIPTHYGPESHKVGFWLGVRYGLGIILTLIEYMIHRAKWTKLEVKKFKVPRKYS